MPKKIFVSGHNGLVGSSLVRALANRPEYEVLTISRQDLDLTNYIRTKDYLCTVKPDVVIQCAARVGGIAANSKYPAEFICENLLIETSVIDGAYHAGVKTLVFLSSSCVYPKNIDGMMKVEQMLTGPFEPTNSAYAAAKYAGMEMCAAYSKQYGVNYFSLIPASLYGPNDNFDPESSHVLPALIHRFHQAKVEGKKSIVLWGSGRPKREFMYVDDAARAIIYLSENYSAGAPMNIGIGEDCEIRELARLVKKTVGFEGEVVFDTTKPDGMMRKLVDSSQLKSLGFKPSVGLEEGLEKTYQWYLKNFH